MLSILDQANIMNNSEQQIIRRCKKDAWLADKEQILNLLEKIILGDDNSSIKYEIYLIMGQTLN